MRAFAALFVPDAKPEQVASFVRIQNQSISAENAAHPRQAVNRVMVVENLPHVQAPVLVVHARDDAIHPLSQGQLQAQTLPKAEFMVLDLRNHAPLPQGPTLDPFVAAMTAFCLES